jgi:hypothetical protein
MEYFATGEGFTYEINFCVVDTPEQAIEKHLDKFIGIGPKYKNSRDYFRLGVQALRLKSATAKKLLQQWFVNSESIYNHLNAAGIEMQFKIYYNHS